MSPSRAAFSLLEIIVVLAIVFAFAAMAIVVISDVLYLHYMEDAKVDVTKMKMKALEKAALAYEKKHHSWPTDVRILAFPSDGSPPYIEEDVIYDGWGKKFAIELLQDEAGATKPMFSTTSPNGDRITSWDKN